MSHVGTGNRTLSSERAASDLGANSHPKKWFLTLKYNYVCVHVVCLNVSVHVHMHSPWDHRKRDLQPHRVIDSVVKAMCLFLLFASACWAE